MIPTFKKLKEDYMRYSALAADYDGTLAKDGKVNPAAANALKKFRNTGRKLLLVTGREIDELLKIFPEIKIFDIVVAENGALLYYPDSGREELLCEPPPPLFLEKLRELNVSPFSAGKVIVASRRPQEEKILTAIRELGLDLRIIFNKEAVMVLPAGINKASGLSKALNELNISPRNTAAVGDAENDYSFMRSSGFSAAVLNAIPMLKETADICLTKNHGEGVAEFIEMLLKNDPGNFIEKLSRDKNL